MLLFIFSPRVLILTFILTKIPIPISFSLDACLKFMLYFSNFFCNAMILPMGHHHISTSTQLCKNFDNLQLIIIIITVIIIITFFPRRNEKDGDGGDDGESDNQGTMRKTAIIHTRT